MGVLESIISWCPCTTRPPKPVISPDSISHPYPLLPKPRPPNDRGHTHDHAHGHGIAPPKATFRPVSQIRSTAYQPLHSPASFSSAEAESADVRQRGPPQLSGLGLGIDPAMYSLRAPDRTYITADKDRIRGSVHGSGHTEGGASARGRRLKKTRMVEGDWELVRQDVEEDEVLRGWTRVEIGDGQETRFARPGGV